MPNIGNLLILEIRLVTKFLFFIVRRLNQIYYLWNAEKPLQDAPRINYLQALLAHPYWNSSP
jgi:hypothetical protein